MNLLISYWSLRKASNMETTNQINKPSPETKTLVSVPNKNELPIRLSRPLMFALIIFVLLVTTNIVLMLTKKPPVPNFTPTPTPISQIPAASTSTNTREVSQYGKTPQFQDFEKKLTDIESANKTIDLSETTLGFPVVEMHVDYENQ